MHYYIIKFQGLKILLQFNTEVEIIKFIKITDTKENLIFLQMLKINKIYFKHNVIQIKKKMKKYKNHLLQDSIKTP